MTLREVCRAETWLTDKDICRLEKVEALLPIMAELFQVDVFIDCMNRSGIAVVAAQGSPQSVRGLYRQSVVGEKAYQDREPAVYQVFQSGLCRHDLKATTQEGREVKQSIVPLAGVSIPMAGVLIAERDISEDILRAKKYRELERTVENMSNTQLAMRTYDQNTIAMREIHHRVKNNLQLIASMLNMQARKTESEETRKILQENVNRVLSIATIHDILTLTPSGEQRTYVSSTELLDKLRRNFQGLVPDGKSIVIRVEGDDLRLSPDCATSVSLVVSELINNAIEHAFPQRDSGQIVIRSCYGRMNSSIAIEDDGVGFCPEDVRKGSLGMSIVRATVEGKLGGKLWVKSGPEGTSVQFHFDSNLGN